MICCASLFRPSCFSCNILICINYYIWQCLIFTGVDFIALVWIKSKVQTSLVKRFRHSIFYIRRYPCDHANKVMGVNINLFISGRLRNKLSQLILITLDSSSEMVSKWYPFVWTRFERREKPDIMKSLYAKR